MDADLQHDETALPEMLRLMRAADLDIVIGSRYAPGGSIGDWTDTRADMSRIATALSRVVCKQSMTDPMSGFFMIRRAAFDASVHRLSALGFKILLDIVASASTPLRIAELPYRFGMRTAGESKLDSLAIWEFAMLLLDKTVGRYVPVRFISFAAVGTAGVLVHMSALTMLLKIAHLRFMTAQTIATTLAMVFNFWLNNVLTYRDRRLHGWKLVRGLLTFMAACSVGALANIGIASFLFANKAQWAAAALAGVIIGAVWNYAVTQIYTWKASK
jgi:dolichol-phosphate mannosyltransferase